MWRKQKHKNILVMSTLTWSYIGWVFARTPASFLIEVYHLWILQLLNSRFTTDALQTAWWWTVWKTYSLPTYLIFSSNLWLPSLQQRAHITLLSARGMFYIPRLTATMLHFRAMLTRQQSFSVSSHPVCRHTGYKYPNSSLTHKLFFHTVSFYWRIKGTIC